MKRGVIFGLAMLCAIGVQAANFTNLDFEAYSGEGMDYLPGWSNNWNVCRDCYPLEGAWIGLLTTSNEYNTPLIDEASLFLGTGNLFLYGVDEIWVSQNAEVPADTTYIRFLTTLQGAGASLGGLALITNSPVENPPGVYCYTADIRSLAGLEAELKIGLGESAWGRHQLDQIEFLDAFGAVIWPLPSPLPPYDSSARCLEDFHAAILNTSLWEVVEAAADVYYSISSETLYLDVPPPAASSETGFWYVPVLRGDWDIVMDYSYSAPFPVYNSNAVVCGLTLAADFGLNGTSQADVGLMIDTANLEWFYGVDWGQGPSNTLAATTQSGMFRLVRTGWDVTGYIWETGSNQWITVGTSGGYTADTARVGVKVWSTGAWSGKNSHYYADNLMLVDGQVCLDGMAVKVFGLDSNGVPSVSWDSVGIAETNRYFVTKATNLLDPDWEAVSGALGESAESNQWTGSALDASPVYYRIEVAPE